MALEDRFLEKQPGTLGQLTPDGASCRSSEEMHLSDPGPLNKMHRKSILKPIFGWDLSIHFIVKFFLVSNPTLT